MSSCKCSCGCTRRADATNVTAGTLGKTRMPYCAGLAIIVSCDGLAINVITTGPVALVLYNEGNYCGPYCARMDQEILGKTGVDLS